MRILQRAPQSYPRSACPVPAQRIAHHFPRHRALRLHRESASGCRAAEDFGERREFAVLDDATRTTAREQSAEVRGLQLYPISRTGQRARGERRSNGRKDVWLGCFSAVGTLTGCLRPKAKRKRDHQPQRARAAGPGFDSLCGSKLWNYPDGAPKHSHACSKEERGGSLRARSGAPDYTYKPDSEAEPRSRYAATAHLEMTAPNPSRCLHLALAQLLSSRDRLAGLAPVFMSPMPACASERASNRHNHRHT